MGKLNILHHKTWHVYSKANKAKVQKDEALALLEDTANKARKDQADQERRLDIMRENSRPASSKSEKKKRLRDGERPETNINLFEDMDRLEDLDKKAERVQRFEKFTTYLGPTYDGSKMKMPWYSKTAMPNPEPTGDKQIKRDSHAKSNLDPMSKHLSKPDGTKMPMSAGSSNIEFLRKERLKREQSERERVEKLLNPDRNERHEAEPDFFNSQFNPDLIRESKKERKFKGREY